MGYRMIILCLGYLISPGLGSNRDSKTFADEEVAKIRSLHDKFKQSMKKMETNDDCEASGKLLDKIFQLCKGKSPRAIKDMKTHKILREITNEIGKLLEINEKCLDFKSKQVFYRQWNRTSKFMIPEYNKDKCKQFDAVYATEDYTSIGSMKSFEVMNTGYIEKVGTNSVWIRWDHNEELMESKYENKQFKIVPEKLFWKKYLKEARLHEKLQKKYPCHGTKVVAIRNFTSNWNFTEAQQFRVGNTGYIHKFEPEHVKIMWDHNGKILQTQKTSKRFKIISLREFRKIVAGRGGKVQAACLKHEDLQRKHPLEKVHNHSDVPPPLPEPEQYQDEPDSSSESPQRPAGRVEKKGHLNPECKNEVYPQENTLIGDDAL